MWSVSSSSLQLILVPPWKLQTKLLYHHSNSNNLNIIPPYFHPIFNSFSKDEPLSSTPNKYQLRYDPSEEIFGLDDVGVPQRDMKSDTFEPRSWFGPNGQYIKELPCPSCRGRGYTPCTECGIERSRQDCSLCNGKGMMTCQRCLGECVIWEELIDEIPWEKARSISPIKVKEDDDVDNMELKPAERKKSNRVYRSTPPEVGQKISRSLKSLNAKTGLFSKRMKLIHRDPTLHAQRVAAIKKVKGTAASRKHTSEMLKKFFSDPENRRKRSISMRGVRFFCKNCGQEGHRSFYCPQRGETADRRFKCGLCGQKGHNRLTCQRPRTSKPKKRILGEYCCRACGKVGHNRRTCPVKIEISSHNAAPKKRGSHCSVCGKSGHNKRTCLQHANEEQPNLNTEKKHHCRVCGEVGHNRRTCSLKTVQPHNAAHENPSLFQDSKGNDQKHHHRCSRCGKVGHNRRTCSQQYSVEKPELNAAVSQSVRRPHHCRICGVIGHNKRTCAERELKAL